MLVLSIIEKKDEEGVDTDIEYIAELARLFKSHAEYVIYNLLNEEYVKPKGSNEEGRKEKVSHDGDHSQVTRTKLEGERTQDLLTIQDYDVTQKGKAILEKRQEQLKELVTVMVRLYEKKDTEELYNYVIANKDWIPLMLHTQILSINNLKNVLSLLGIDLPRLREDELQKNLGDLGIDPGLLTAGLIIVNPLAALIAYVLTNVIIGKLVEKYEQQSQERYAEYRIV